MNILMINKFLHPNGGSETYIFKLGKSLQEHGHEVQYFGMEHPNRCVGNKVNAYTSEMNFHSNSLFQKIGYVFKTVYSKEARIQIRKVLDSFSPDVCHLNNFNYQLTPSIILEIVKWRKQTGKKCKILFTAHDYQLLCPNHMMNNPNTHKNCEKCVESKFYHCINGKCIHGSFFKSLVGAIEAYFWNLVKVYRYFDVIICPSNFIKSKMDSKPLFKDKTIFLRNFIDKVEYKKKENRDYVLYFGRYSKEKGVGTLIAAAKKLPSIPFVFAGKGDCDEEINSVSNITNVSFQSEESIHNYIRGARFSICPSEWYENCPFSVLESQSLGTPVLGANIGGIPELIADGRTGEIFESGNVEDLERKISFLWKKLDTDKSYFENCLKFNYQYIDSYVKNYTDLLN